MKPLVIIRAGTMAALLACPVAGAAEDAADTKDMTVLEDKREFVPWEKGSVRFGWFAAIFSSDLGFGINDAAGVTFSAEDLFGLDTSLMVFRGEAMYRPGESRRNQIDFTYAAYHRSGSATLSEDIIIDGVTYPMGSEVDTTFNFDIIRGTYSYAILQDERVRIAVGVGAYAVPLKYGLEITTSGGGSTIKGADTTLPLPALALRGECQLLPKLFLNGSVDAMYLEISDFKGSLLDVNVGLEYRPWEHVGFGVGYNSMSVDVQAEDSSSSYPGVNFVGTVNVHFSGLMLYGKLNF